MPQNFIECDREQAYLMPPSLRDWVAEDHLVWTILGAVEEMDLSAFYAAYRADGHGRPAYEPSMMVALLLYAYARGNRSSRGIERECQEDVAYRVIAANRVPDHSTIAEFRKRHEVALADLFGEVLRLCRAAGMVRVGLVAVDGTKVAANASHERNADYVHLAREILAEADRIDREEDELYGDARGDELPEQLRTAEGRRAALREAKRRLAEQAEDRLLDQDNSAGSSTVEVELDPADLVGRVQGRRGWLREAKHQLDEQRKQRARPIPRSRRERLLEAERRMQEELAVERAANQAYEHWRARRLTEGTAGHKIGGPPKPYEPPEEPPGRVNLTDPDSRMMQTWPGWIQAYNAQAAVSEDHMLIAAEIAIESPDFGHLEPVVAAAEGELERAGASERPGAVVADAGYWHAQQMESIVSRGIPVIIPPDANTRKGERPGWNNGLYRFMRNVIASEHGGQLYRRRQALIEPVFGDIKFNRRTDRFLRRGRSAARSEWRLITATHNLLKLHRHRIAPAIA
jgi:transposase